MQEFRHARLDGLAGFQEVATHEEVGFTRLCAGEQRELGGSLGVLPPQLSNPGVRRSRGISMSVRTLAGSGSAVAPGSAVIEKRKRPRLLLWLSSLFQPP